MNQPNAERPCDPQEHATEAEYIACPICNPPMTDAQMLADVEGRLDYRREEAEALRLERDQYRASCIVLREQLDVAEAEVAAVKAKLAAVEGDLFLARDEIGRLREQAAANAQIMQGEQYVLKTALEHLKKVWEVARDADTDFNFSEEGVP